MRKVFFLLSIFFVFSSVYLLISPGKSFAADQTCYYCENYSEQNITGSYAPDGYFIDRISGTPGDGPHCELSYTTGGSAGQEAPYDGGVCSTDLCNHSTGCVDDPGQAQCIEPVGECSDETNGSCRNPASCTNIYCVVTINGTDYQWTRAYGDQTDLKGICKTLPSEPDTPPGGGCQNDTDCQSGNKCVEGKCTSTTKVECSKATEATDCFSGKCKANGTCATGYVSKVCNKVGVNSDDYRCRTAIGYIYTNPQTFSRNILRLVLGFAGGILLLMIILNGYKFMTSQGDPEKIKDAREGIIAAIAGILLIIFSLSILQLITVDIIGIPGFSR